MDNMDKMYTVYAIAQSVGYVLAIFKNKEDAVKYCDSKDWVDEDEDGNEWYLEIIREEEDPT